MWLSLSGNATALRRRACYLKVTFGGHRESGGPASNCRKHLAQPEMREEGLEPSRLAAQEPKSQAGGTSLSPKPICCQQFNERTWGESTRISPLSPYFFRWIESITASAMAVSSSLT